MMKAPITQRKEVENRRLGKIAGGQPVTQVKRFKVEKWGGLEVSRLGFGCMRLPLGEDKKIDRVKAAEMVDTAIKGGINYFDTAYVYHDGESELFLGETMKKYPRESFHLATKLPVWQIKAEEDVATIFNDQLRKLQTDYIDFYLLHGLSGPRMKKVNKYGLIEKLQQKKKEGKIKFLGFSYHGDADSFKELVNMGIWDFAQIQINYVDYNMIDAKALYDTFLAAKLPCVVMEPVRGGFLANPPEAMKSLMAGFEGGKVTPAGWAFRWCMNQEGMNVILSGMSTMEQMTENIETFSSADKLSPAQDAMIAKAAEILAGIKSVPCTGCRYCMECPSGVDIPQVFDIYNRYMLFRNAFRGNEEYSALTAAGHGADKCTRCGNCSPQCPQSIEIPDKLAEAKEVLEKLMQ